MQSKKIAQDYESFLANHPLFELDIQLVQSLLQDVSRRSTSTNPLIVADLGCGTGRVARQCAANGIRFLNIDLSQPMLEESVRLNRSSAASANASGAAAKNTAVKHAATKETVSGDPPDNCVALRGNLAELSFLREQSIDLAVCLFSSIGMIRERRLRVDMLRFAALALKPDCSLLLHVHNRWQSLWQPNGWSWLLTSFVKSLRGQSEFGDRVYAYRGLPSMYLHIYDHRELRQDLKAAGYRRLDIIPISGDGSRKMKNHLLNRIRCGGYFAVATV